MTQLKQRYHSNKELENTKKYKGIVPIQGRLYADCVVQSVNKGRLITSNEIGESSGNMMYFDNHYMRALENAIYKHFSSGGVSGARVIKINNYQIKYFNDDVKVKRVKKQDFKIIQVPPHTRIEKKKVKTKVKGYTRQDGTKVKGYTREKLRYVEVKVKGYERKVPKGRGSYATAVQFKGERVLTTPYKRRSIKHLNKELLNINIAKNKALFVDKI